MVSGNQRLQANQEGRRITVWAVVRAQQTRVVDVRPLHFGLRLANCGCSEGGPRIVGFVTQVSPYSGVDRPERLVRRVDGAL